MTKRLGRVTHLLTGDGDFFGEHAQVVGVGEDVVEMRQGQLAQVGDVDVVACCLVGVSFVLHGGWVMTYSGHGFDEPECNHDECAFAAAHTLRGVLDIEGKRRKRKDSGEGTYHRLLSCDRTGRPSGSWIDLLSQGVPRSSSTC